MYFYRTYLIELTYCSRYCYLCKPRRRHRFDRQLCLD